MPEGLVYTSRTALLPRKFAVVHELCTWATGFSLPDLPHHFAERLLHGSAYRPGIASSSSSLLVMEETQEQVFPLKRELMA